jgi:hypothetical protein
VEKLDLTDDMERRLLRIDGHTDGSLTWHSQVMMSEQHAVQSPNGCQAFLCPGQAAFHGEEGPLCAEHDAAPAKEHSVL